jgi:hypothetical protein
MKKQKNKKSNKMKIVLVLVIINLVLWGFLISTRITGNAISTTIPAVDAQRKVRVVGNELIVEIAIKSNQNVVAIKDSLTVYNSKKQVINSNFEVLSYKLSGTYQGFEYKTSEKTWIIADKSKKVNTILTYRLKLPSGINNGKFSGQYIYLLNNNLASKEMKGTNTYSKR